MRVRLSPNSSSCKRAGIFKDPAGVEFLKIHVISVPEKGKANKELIAFLAKELKIAKSDIGIVFGGLDRYKTLVIKSRDRDLIEKLESWY